MFAPVPATCPACPPWLWHGASMCADCAAVYFAARAAEAAEARLRERAWSDVAKSAAEGA